MRRAIAAACALTLLCACRTATKTPTLTDPEQAAQIVPGGEISSDPILQTGLVSVYSADASGSYASEPGGQENIRYHISVPYLQFRGRLLSYEAEQEQINVYYAGLQEQLLSYATTELGQSLTEDEAAYLNASFTVMYLEENRRVISILRQLDTAGETVLQAETFALDSGGLLILDDFFTGAAEDYQPVVLGAIGSALDAMDFDYDPETVETAFDRNAFYVTDAQLVFLYPAGALRDVPTEVAVDFSALGDTFQLPDCFT